MKRLLDNLRLFGLNKLNLKIISVLNYLFRIIFKITFSSYYSMLKKGLVNMIIIFITLNNLKSYLQLMYYC